MFLPSQCHSDEVGYLYYPIYTMEADVDQHNPITPIYVVLVGGFNISEKYESKGMIISNYYGKIKVRFQSPPTSL